MNRNRTITSIFLTLLILIQATLSMSLYNKNNLKVNKNLTACFCCGFPSVPPPGEPCQICRCRKGIPERNSWGWSNNIPL